MTFTDEERHQEQLVALAAIRRHIRMEILASQMEHMARQIRTLLREAIADMEPWILDGADAPEKEET